MAVAQTTVTGTIVDGNRQPVTNATIWFQAISSVSFQPLSYQNGAGNTVVVSPVSTQLGSGGTFSISLDDAVPTKPSNIGYAVTITDNVTGKQLLGVGYGCIQPTGANWDLSQYNPLAQPGMTVVQGPPGPAGDVNTTQLAAAVAPANAILQPFLGYGPTAIQLITFGSSNLANNNTTPAGIGAFLPTPQAFSASGSLTSISLSLSTGAGTTIDVVIGVRQNANPGFSVVDRITLTAKNAGLNVFNAGTDFAFRNVSAGQYLGFEVTGTARARFVDGAVSGAPQSPGFWFCSQGLSGGGSPNTAAVLPPGQLDLSAVVAGIVPGTGAQPLPTSSSVQSQIDTSLQPVNVLLTPFLGYGSPTTQSVVSGASNLAGDTTTTPNAVIAAFLPDSQVFTLSGALTAISIMLATGAGSTIDAVIGIKKTANPGFTVVDRITLTAKNSGLNTFNVGVDFLPRNVIAGQYLGFETTGSGRARFIDGYQPGAPQSPGFWFCSQGLAGGGSANTAAVLPPGQLDLSATVSGLALGAGSQPIPTPASVQSQIKNATSPWVGKKWGRFGDSISAGNPGQFVSTWAAQASAYHQMTLQFQDCRYARFLNQIFENYSGSPLVRQTSATNPASVLTGATVGNTLAQDLAGLDLLMIELLTNTPTNPFGSPTDTQSANTACGDMNYALSQIHAANPTMRVVWITPYQANPSGGAMATQSQFVQLNTLIKQVCLLWGDPVIDMGALYGANANTWATLLRDGVHPTDGLGYTRYANVINSALNNIAG